MMRSDPSSTPDVPGIPAAQYVRMSTEHQKYSTANQADTNSEYAARRGFVIVRTYADEGKSGLRFAGRDALRQLIADVESGDDPGFRSILVYDVSRWGRFQDVDESAYYEYLCRRAGIDVHYCAEQFDNDGSPTAAILKTVKRAMAGEYSRELSVKTFKAACRLVTLGYRQGGRAGYGLRRLLIGPDGASKGILAVGQRKYLGTDRVILVPGPVDEVRVVRRIFREFTNERKSQSKIAADLNADGLSTDLGRKWTRTAVHQVLTSEKYIGNNVYNRSSFKLKKRLVRNSAETWVRAESAFEAVISKGEFEKAQIRLRDRQRLYSDEVLIARLKTLISRHLAVSSRLINAARETPTSMTYLKRFGSLRRAYQLAGYGQDERDYSYVEINRRLELLRLELVDEVLRWLNRLGAAVTQDPRSEFLVINGEFTAKVLLARCRQTAAGSLRWLLRTNEGFMPDVTILVRMDAANEHPVDYYLLPIIDRVKCRAVLCEGNGAHLEAYQFDNLDFLAQMARRRRIEVPS